MGVYYYRRIYKLIVETRYVEKAELADEEVWLRAYCASVSNSRVGISPDKIYKFRESGKLIWLQKILFKILDKLDAFEYQKISTVTSVTVNTKTVFETLMRQAEFSKYDFNQTPKQLIIGDKTFRELMGCEEFRNYVSFLAPGEFYDEFGSIMGFKVKIKIVPWWDGCVLLPEDL